MGVDGGGDVAALEGGRCRGGSGDEMRWFEDYEVIGSLSSGSG